MDDRRDEPAAGTGPHSGPAGQSTSHGRLDHHRLELLSAIGPDSEDLLVTLVEIFIAEAPGDLGSIINAVSCGDAVAVRRAAHRMQGAAGILGATSVARLCVEIEELAKAGKLDDAEGLLGGLKAELDATAAALRRAVPRQPDDPP